MRKLLIACLFLPSTLSSAQAAIWSPDLSSASQLDATLTTGIWNTGLARLQAGVAPGGDTSKRVNFGDGSDGAFENGPEQTGITVSGTTITLNTDVKAVFQFTSFTLSSGYTINVTGSQTLRVRVLGPVVLAGTVTGNGLPGANNGTAGVGNATTGLLAGGAAGPGGGSGGNGGSLGPTLESVNGSAGGASSGGGVRFPNTASTGNNRGGGGACLGTGPDAGNNATAAPGTGGAAGTCALDRSAIAAAFETTFHGGAGGGGGAAYTGGAPVGGGGGGGGGGALHLASAGNVTLSGTVQLKGGDGGDNDADADGTQTNCGGGGGGGSGGAFWLQTAGSLSGSGTVDVSRGTQGGSGATCSTPAALGGHGSRGITRRESLGSAADGLTTVPAALNDSASAISVPVSSDFEVVSKAFQLGSYLYSLGSASLTLDTTSAGCGAGGSASLSFQGSSDGVDWGTSRSVDTLSELDGANYLRFRVAIRSDGTGSAPCVTGVTLHYDLKTLTELELTGGLACLSVRQRGSQSSSAIPPLSLLMTALAAWLGVQLAKISFRRSSSRHS